jgi:hypothetical protein
MNILDGAQSQPITSSTAQKMFTAVKNQPIRAFLLRTSIVGAGPGFLNKIYLIKDISCDKKPFQEQRQRSAVVEFTCRSRQPLLRRSELSRRTRVQCET